MIRLLPIEILEKILLLVEYNSNEITLNKLQFISKHFCNVLGNKNHIAFLILKSYDFNVKLCKINFFKLYFTIKKNNWLDNPAAAIKYYISLSSQNRNFDIVKLLLTNSRIDPSANGNYLIILASSRRNFEIVKLWLTDARVDPSACNNYLIKSASENGNFEIVKLLLTNARVDPSTQDNYSIRYASKNGHLEIVKLLLTNARVDPSAKDNYSIRYASKNGHFEIVKLLLTNARVDPSAQDNYSIQHTSNIEIVELLLRESRVKYVLNVFIDDLRKLNTKIKS